MPYFFATLFFLTSFTLHGNAQGNPPSIVGTELAKYDGNFQKAATHVQAYIFQKKLHEDPILKPDQTFINNLYTVARRGVLPNDPSFLPMLENFLYANRIQLKAFLKVNNIQVPRHPKHVPESEKVYIQDPRLRDYYLRNYGTSSWYPGLR